MAAVIDFEMAGAQREIDDSRAAQGVRFAIDHARSLGARNGVPLLQRFQRQIAAVEAELLAERITDGGDTSGAERLLGDGKTSRREQKKRARRAKAVAKNKKLADKMADGEMSEEQVDVIADASAKTDGAAACDDELIDRVAGVDPDQGRGIADQFVADRATADGVQSEHDRQRALRRASKYNSKKNNLDAICIEGDSVAATAMWQAIKQRADEMYRRDGGRELTLSAHPRTNEQRLFDAAREILCGIIVHPDGTTTPKDNNGAGTSRSRSRPQIVIGLTLDKALGLDRTSSATQIGLGLIPDSVLADYAAHADFMTALFDRHGEPLWLGRLKRDASTVQLVGLILRDKGCALCGADHTQCEAHHQLPWSAPAKGRTDIDQLVLLCGPCHRRLHRENRTIYRDKASHWQTRPATPHETPPPRPNDTRNQPQQE